MKNFFFKYCRLPNAAILLILIIIFISGCSYVKSKEVIKPRYKIQIPNPALLNCLDKKGILAIQNRGDGGEYGVCIFEDNRQCEEEALFKGECPARGLKITGYVTQAAQYCVITGGSYKISHPPENKYYDFILQYLLPTHEDGTCTFKNDKACNVWDYFNGKCSKDK
jgi:putative hemolysin